VAQVPAGITTTPPPAADAAAMVAAIAAVLSVTPSGTAPNRAMENRRRGMRGRLTLAAMRFATASSGT
jgi:hypothetical protein